MNWIHIYIYILERGEGEGKKKKKKKRDEVGDGGERKAWKEIWGLDNFRGRAHRDKDMKQLKGKQLWNKEWEW